MLIISFFLVYLSKYIFREVFKTEVRWKSRCYLIEIYQWQRTQGPKPERENPPSRQDQGLIASGSEGLWMLIFERTSAVSFRPCA